MILLILESLGTWELLLVGVVALVIFGPRKIPELARKAGKILAEFRKVSDDFRATWEREAMLDEDEKKAFDFSDEAIAREPSPPMIEEVAGPEAFETNDEDPETDESDLDSSADSDEEKTAESDVPEGDDISESSPNLEPAESKDKENWL